MSRHIFDTRSAGRPVQVVLGHDPRLGCFYLTVQRLGSSSAQRKLSKQSDTNEDCGYLYSSHADPDAQSRTDLQYFWDRLQSLAIAVPERMFRAVSSDADNQRGNRVVRHFTDGTQKVLSKA
jgi:hypothetical protein